VCTFPFYFEKSKMSSGGIQRRGEMYQRASVADYISPDNGLRGKMERKGHQPKNHMKDNYNNLRDVQEKNRMRREDESANPKELYKLSQFRDVGARVFEPVPANSSGRNLSENHEGVFLVRGAAERRREELAEEGRMRRKQVEDSLNEAKMFSDHQPSGSAGSSSPRKRSVPRADELVISSSSNKPPTDFINRNKKSQVMMDRKNSSELTRANSSGSDSRHESYGRVPGYLVNRKNEWAELEEERKRNAPDPSCPRGMCLMPEEERQATLATLFDSRQECLRQLERMPFVIETPSAKRRVEELEKKLREIEKAIEIFNKPKVYVAK
jgi:hypothetical protein